MDSASRMADRSPASNAARDGSSAAAGWITSHSGGLLHPRPHRRRRSAAAEFFANFDGNVNFLKQAGQNLDGANQNQIVQRSRVGNNNPHLRCEAQSPQRGAFSLQVFPREVEPHFVSLQEPVQFIASPKPQYLPQLRLGQSARLVFFQGERFQCPARQIAPRSRKPLGHIIGNVQRQLHARSLPRTAQVARHVKGLRSDDPPPGKPWPSLLTGSHQPQPGHREQSSPMLFLLVDSH